MTDIKIYRINLDLDVNRLAFEPLDYVKTVDPEKYQRVYEGSVKANDLVERPLFIIIFLKIKMEQWKKVKSFFVETQFTHNIDKNTILG